MTRSAILIPSQIAYYEKGHIKTFIVLVRVSDGFRIFVTLAKDEQQAFEMAVEGGIPIEIVPLFEAMSRIEELQLSGAAEKMEFVQ